MLDARGVRDAYPDSWGHVGNNKIHGAGSHHFLQLFQDFVLAEVALDEFHPATGSMGRMSRAMMRPSTIPPGPASSRATWDQLPGAEPVDHQVAAAHQLSVSRISMSLNAARAR